MRWPEPDRQRYHWRGSKRRLDFQELGAAALDRAHDLVPRWLPDGRARGPEWVARNPTRSDRNAGSFVVSLHKGCWKDFACGDYGRDLISLYAYINGLEQRQAALLVAEELGLVGAA